MDTSSRGFARTKSKNLRRRERKKNAVAPFLFFREIGKFILLNSQAAQCNKVCQQSEQTQQQSKREMPENETGFF